MALRTGFDVVLVALRKIAWPGITGSVLVLASGCLDRASINKATIVDACMEEANTRAACTCMADAAHETLEEPVFLAMVAGADRRTADADEAWLAMSDRQKQSVADFVRAMPGRCNMPPVEGVS